MIHSAQSQAADMLRIHSPRILGRGWGSRLRPVCDTLIAAQKKLVGSRSLFYEYITYTLGQRIKVSLTTIQ